MTDLEIANKVAFSHLNTFYSWGGDDPSGFDCSGFVIEILKSTGRLKRRFDTTASGLWQKFYLNKVDDPSEGCLVFFLNSSATIRHVEYCLDEKFMIGASGGGKAVKQKEDAIKANAFIKIRTIKSDQRSKLYVNPFKEN